MCTTAFTVVQRSAKSADIPTVNNRHSVLDNLDGPFLSLSHYAPVSLFLLNILRKNFETKKDLTQLWDLEHSERIIGEGFFVHSHNGHLPVTCQHDSRGMFTGAYGS